MKTIGLLGGLTYHATLLYYAQINAQVQARMPKQPVHHSAKILIHSFDFAEMSTLFRAGKWDEAGRRLVSAAKGLVDAGATGILLCVNTGHRAAEVLERELSEMKGPGGEEVKFLHIIDYSGAAAKEKGLKKVGLLGTTIVTEQGFMVERLAKGGVEALVPANADLRKRLDTCIFGDLAKGLVTDEVKEVCMAMVKDVMGRGAEGVILACTELGFVLKEGDEGVDVPLFETVELHVKGAVDWALEDEKLEETEVKN